MHTGQPAAPIRKLQGDGNLTRVEIAVGAKDVWGNLPYEFTHVGNASWRIRG